MKHILTAALLSSCACFMAAATAGSTMKLPELMDLALTLNLTTFVGHLRTAGLDSVIDGGGGRKFTLFAPDNAAFERFEQQFSSQGKMSRTDLLRFHVALGSTKYRDMNNEVVLKTLLPSRNVRLNVYRENTKDRVVSANGRQMTSLDHEAHNGVIHVMGDVMSSAFSASIVSEMDKCCPKHSKLMALVKKAGLYKVLKKRGPFTFIQPSDKAFDELDQGYLEKVSSNKTALRRLLLTHVVPGTLYTVALSNGDVIKALSGVKLCVSVCKGTIKFGNSVVEVADLNAGNGVIFSVSQVMKPDDHKYTAVKCLPSKCDDDDSSAEAKVTAYGPFSNIIPDIPGIPGKSQDYSANTYNNGNNNPYNYQNKYSTNNNYPNQPRYPNDYSNYPNNQFPPFNPYNKGGGDYQDNSNNQDQQPNQGTRTAHKKRKGNVFKVLNKIGCSRFAQILSETHYTIDFLTNYTVFAPSDASMPEYMNIENAYHFTKTHVIPTALISKDNVENDMLFDSMDLYSKLRINIYGQYRSVYTVNGKEFEMHPHYFDKGVIYKLEPGKHLEPSTQTLYEVITNNPDLRGLASEPGFQGFQGTLLQYDYPLTIIAPKTDGSLPVDLNKVMMNHMIPMAMFKPSFRGLQFIATLGGMSLNVTTVADGRLFLNGLEAVETEETPTNGALYTVKGLFM